LYNYINKLNFIFKKFLHLNYTKNISIEKFIDFNKERLITIFFNVNVLFFCCKEYIYYIENFGVILDANFFKYVIAKHIKITYFSI